MKGTSLIRKVPALLLGFLLLSAAPVQDCNCDDNETRVFIDGKEITRDATLITLEKDDTILFEATGLKPNSDVYIKVKKAGIKWAEDTYHVNDTGKVKEILDVPEKNLTVNCTVSWYDGDGDFQTHEFKLKIN